MIWATRNSLIRPGRKTWAKIIITARQRRMRPTIMAMITMPITINPIMPHKNGSVPRPLCSTAVPRCCKQMAGTDFYGLSASWSLSRSSPSGHRSFVNGG